MDVHVSFSDKGCKVIWGDMILTKDVFVGTLFQVDACTIQCNISSISIVKRSMEALASKK